MKKRVREAVLKLMLLQEQFTKKEIDEAVVFLSKGKTDDIIKYLRGKETKNNEEHSSTRRPSHEQQSKVVQSLAAIDPERHAILSEFEFMLRRGRLLPTFDDLKRIGIAASKQFQPAKSRKDTISRFMGILAVMPLENIREIIRKSTDEAQLSEKNVNSYARLAQYLIAGRGEREK